MSPGLLVLNKGLLALLEFPAELNFLELEGLDLVTQIFNLIALLVDLAFNLLLLPRLVPVISQLYLQRVYFL